MKKNKFKCGLVSILGFPNAGKSTLLNNILDKKVSIISPKAQTTRKAIRGVYSKDRDQIVFIDTPGLLKPKSFLNKSMSRSINNSIIQSNINLIVQDVRLEINEQQKKLLRTLISSNKKNFLVLNKIDLIKKNQLFEITKKLNHFYTFNEVFFISALRKKGFEDLIKKIRNNIPYGHWIYEKEIFTDQKIESILSEITREKIFQLLNQELPYSMKVESKLVDKINLFKVYQTIFINKKSQKPILIGKNGCKIKEIGIRARKDIETKLKKKVFLDILVSLETNKSKT